MNRKEWLEVGKQSLIFILAMAGMTPLLVALASLLDGQPLEMEKIIIMMGLWMFVFAMFLGLSPFAMDSKQKGMEYLLTLPYSRRRLLLIKLLPRLAALAFFYCLYLFLYQALGRDVFGNAFVFFNFACFALFFISFSLASVDENFIVQFLTAGIAFSGFWALWLLIMALGFAWQNNLSLGLVRGFGHFGNLFHESKGMLVAFAVFAILLAPFLASSFLAFKKFDLRTRKSYNRRQLSYFVPLFLLAAVLALGVSYRGQQHSVLDEWMSYYLTAGQGLLKISPLGKLDFFDGTGRRHIKSDRDVAWSSQVIERPGALFLIGKHYKDYTYSVTRFELGDFSRKILYRVPCAYLASANDFAFKDYGRNLVFLQRGRVEAESPGMQASLPLKSDRLDLVVLDLDSGKFKIHPYRNPLFRNYNQPEIFAHDEIVGRPFWLIGGKGQKIIRLWSDGGVEDLGPCKKTPVYFGHLLLCQTAHSLTLRRLLASGSETVREIAGEFQIGGFHYNNAMDAGTAAEIYIEQFRKRIVRIDLRSLEVSEIGPDHGYLRFVQPGTFYYVQGRSSAYGKPDNWRKVYRLQDGKMIFLKQFDFAGPGLGSVWVEKHGIVFWDRDAPRFFSFPDLRELKFKNLH